MAITDTQRKRAAALPHREKRRLRRNFIMWEGRLERGLEFLNYLLEERKLPKRDRLMEKSASDMDNDIAAAKADIKECHEKLQKAADEINEALGSNVTIPRLHI